MKRPVLSICVVTMDRAKQLEEALLSCLACQLPEATEFVIIDNASTDDTEQTVKATLEYCGHPYYYERLPENLGVGGGRNYAFSKAKGKYIYSLDDDAVIDTIQNSDFFTSAIDILDRNEEIITLSTQIYDTVWKRDRVEKTGPRMGNGLYVCKMFCGGSHFLRRAFFKTVPYLPNKYGYEEIPPSLRVMDAGMFNAFCPDLLVIHRPAVNKWDWSVEKNQSLLINEIAVPYAIKKMMYPGIMLPLLEVANQMRIKKYMTPIPNADQRVKVIAEAFSQEYPIAEKIKLSTVYKMLKDFKLSIF